MPKNVTSWRILIRNTSNPTHFILFLSAICLKLSQQIFDVIHCLITPEPC